MATIFVSIAAFRDTELLHTVTRLLSNAVNPNNIYLNIFSQDETHPDLESIVAQYGGNLNYRKIDYRETKGVCWARSEIQKNLNASFTYYLQLDSHMAFTQDWDSTIIRDYEEAKKVKGSVIFTVYPAGYEYINGEIKLDNIPCIPRIPIYVESKPTKFLPAEADQNLTRLFPSSYGHPTYWYSGNFAFGDSQIFIETPYDPDFFFDGEEHSLTLRLFSKGVKFLTPPNTCIFHYYKTDKKVYVHNNKELFGECYAKASKHIENFFNFRIEGEFGVTPDVIYKWLIASRNRT